MISYYKGIDHKVIYEEQESEKIISGVEIRGTSYGLEDEIILKCREVMLSWVIFIRGQYLWRAKVFDSVGKKGKEARVELLRWIDPEEEQHQ